MKEQTKIDLVNRDLDLIQDCLQLVRVEIRNLENSSTQELSEKFFDNFMLFSNLTEGIVQKIIPGRRESKLESKTKKIRALNQKIQDLEKESSLGVTPSHMAYFISNLNSSIYSALKEVGVRGFSEAKFVDSGLKIRVWGFEIFQVENRYEPIDKADAIADENRLLKKLFSEGFDSTSNLTKLKITDQNIKKIVKIVNDVDLIQEDVVLKSIKSDEFSKTSHVLESMEFYVDYSNIILTLD